MTLLKIASAGCLTTIVHICYKMFSKQHKDAYYEPHEHADTRALEDGHT